MASRKHDSRRSLGLLALGLFFLPMLACGQERTNEPTLEALAARVLLVPGGIGEGNEVPIGADSQRAIQDGDGVNVFEAGEAMVHFADRWRLHIYRGSNTRIDYHMEADPSSPIVALLLAAGTVAVEEELPNHVSVHTGNGVIINEAGAVALSEKSKPVVITGLAAQFFVHDNPDVQATWVVASEGAVQVEAGGQTVTVPSQFQTMVLGDGVPLPPVPASRLLVRNIFPPVDVLTANRKADDGVLTNQPCRVNAPSDLRDKADPQALLLDSLSLGERFEPVMRVNNATWVWGLDPTQGQWGNIDSTLLDCRYPIDLLPDRAQFDDWLDHQSAIDGNVANHVAELLQGEQLSAPTTPVKVSRASIVTGAGSQDAICPVEVPFAGEIAAAGTGSVKYVWEFSDGAPSDEGTVTFAGEGVQPVRTARAFASSFHGWVRLRVLTPEAVKSDQVEFALNCQPPPVTVRSASIVAEVGGSREAICPAEVPFTGEIVVAGASIVDYVWEFSDGIPSGVESITFTDEGVQPVTTARTFASSFQGWVRLRVLTPEAVKSDRVEFALNCQPPPVAVRSARILAEGVGSLEAICPVEVPFSGEIVATGAGSVNYVWEFSDGIPPKVGSVVFAGEGMQPVTTARSFEDSFNGWVRLRVLAPQEKVSDDVKFALTCQSPPLEVRSASILGDAGMLNAICPTKVSFEGKIVAAGAGSVDYVWEYSDGIPSDVESITFAGEGIQPVTTVRAIESSSQGAVRLHVLAPQDVTSDWLEFTLNCQPSP